MKKNEAEKCRISERKIKAEKREGRKMNREERKRETKGESG